MTHHLDRRHGINHHLGELVLKRTGRTERCALLQRLLQGIENAIVGVADDGGTPRPNVVDVLVAVHIICLAALDPVKDDWLATD